MALKHKKGYLVYMPPAEAEKVGMAAKRLGISRSEYMRRAVTGVRLPPPGNAQSVRDLVTVNADLERLGNLVKLAMDGGTDLGFEGLARQITETQTLLKSKIRGLKKLNDPAEYREG